jgi:uncharacterized protein YbgA (DUF1722 family)/uncharacterized protein YbbK (DUF523 family)
MKPPTSPRLRIGVSSCLLGQEVRFDGGHKRDRFLIDTLGPHVEWVPVCPEVELGLGTPRPAMRLERDAPDQELRMVAPKTATDHTGPMRAFARRRTNALHEEELSGFIFKKDSPSCGLRSVKVYPAKGAPARTGIGLFAEAVIQRFPHLPVEDEGRLQDARLRENFVSHVFAYRRWQDMQREGVTRQRLMRFHQLHKFALLGRNQAGARRLGRLLGSSGKRDPIGALAARYLEEFTPIMSRPPSRQSHTNVLQHLAGFVSRELDAHDRKELAETIDQYRRGLVPLIVPVTLIRHYVRKQQEAYLSEQVYLYAHPHELMLLNQL